MSGRTALSANNVFRSEWGGQPHFTKLSVYPKGTTQSNCVTRFIISTQKAGVRSVATCLSASAMWVVTGWSNTDNKNLAWPISMSKLSSLGLPVWCQVEKRLARRSFWDIQSLNWTNTTKKIAKNSQKNLKFFSNRPFSQKILCYIYYSTCWRRLHHVDEHSGTTICNEPHWFSKEPSFSDWIDPLSVKNWPQVLVSWIKDNCNSWLEPCVCWSGYSAKVYS